MFDISDVTDVESWKSIKSMKLMLILGHLRVFVIHNAKACGETLM